jgi:hypothetical protein
MLSNQKSVDLIFDFDIYGFFLLFSFFGSCSFSVGDFGILFVHLRDTSIITKSLFFSKYLVFPAVLLKGLILFVLACFTNETLHQ